MYQFKQAVHIDGKDFPRGIHKVSESVEKHPHFLKYVSLGLIVESQPAPMMGQSAQERGEKLMNKLVKKADAGKSPAPEMVKEEAPAEVESADEEKPKGKSGKKSR